MIYDCFTFYNELDLLELRLNTLDEVVDRFVIVEMIKTFTNKEKPLYFLAHKERFARFLPKILYSCITEMPPFETSWQYESFQRNYLARVLAEKNAQSADTVILSDVDEIPNPISIQPFLATNDLLALELKNYQVYMNAVCSEKHYGALMMTYQHSITALDHVDFPDTVYAPAKYNSGTTMTKLRMLKNEWNLPIVNNAGWHFSCLGNAETLWEKVHATCWYDEPTLPSDLRNATKDTLVPILESGYIKYFEKIDSSYPPYLVQNQKKFSKYISVLPYLS